jgi:hypothetical protein
VTKFEPYQIDGKWYCDKDPDDKLYYVADVRQSLADALTTAVSFEIVAQGVEVLEKGEPQGDRGGLLVVKLGGMGAPDTLSFCTFRVTCANTEQFDRTIWFKTADN